MVKLGDLVFERQAPRRKQLFTRSVLRRVGIGTMVISSTARRRLLYTITKRMIVGVEPSLKSDRGTRISAFPFPRTLEVTVIAVPNLAR